MCCQKIKTRFVDVYSLSEWKGKNIHKRGGGSWQKLNISWKKKEMEVKHEGRTCVNGLTGVKSNAAISVMRDGRFMVAVQPRKWKY